MNLLKLKSVFAVVVPAALLLSASAAWAETKIGFINLQRVSNEAPQAVKAMKKIKAEFEKRDLDLQKLSKQLQTMQDKLEKDSATRVIKKIAEAEKYDLIVQEVVYASAAIDITPKVIKALSDGNAPAPAP